VVGCREETHSRGFKSKGAKPVADHRDLKSFKKRLKFVEATPAPEIMQKIILRQRGLKKRETSSGDCTPCGAEQSSSARCRKIKNKRYFSGELAILYIE